MTKRDDLVSSLRDEAMRLSGQSIDRGCVDSGIGSNLADAAADALTEARAEIERQADWIRCLQAALMFWMPGVDMRLDDATRELAADDAKLLSGYSGPLDCSCWGDEILARAISAESELSTLRARVREVVGPFARLDTSHTDDIDDSALVFENEGGNIVLGHLRAACQLMEEVK